VAVNDTRVAGLRTAASDVYKLLRTCGGAQSTLRLEIIPAFTTDSIHAECKCECVIIFYIPVCHYHPRYIIVLKRYFFQPRSILFTIVWVTTVAYLIIHFSNKKDKQRYISLFCVTIILLACNHDGVNIKFLYCIKPYDLQI